MLFEKNDRILFTGDSVTDFGRKRPVGEGLGEGVGPGYVRTVESFINVFYPELNLRISNTGNSGDTSKDLLARYEQDVINLKPQWLSILIGVNDVWRQFDTPAITEDHVLPEAFYANMEEMVTRAKPVVKGIFLMTPVYMEINREDAMRKRLDEYGKIIKEISHKNGCILVDLQSAFDQFFTIRHSSFVAWDRVHPNQTGAMIIANEFLKYAGFDKNRLF
ncbi:MAG: GDSL family lipase [Lachnospiraceae bacterium]|nr:GDSL family lipase [Lachnospiraceae bacterium]